MHVGGVVKDCIKNKRYERKCIKRHLKLKRSVRCVTSDKGPSTT